MVRILIKEILSLIKKKGYIPHIWRSNDHVFITVDKIIMISIHKNDKIRVSRSTNPSECRCEFLLSEEKLMKMLETIPTSISKKNYPC